MGVRNPTGPFRLLRDVGNVKPLACEVVCGSIPPVALTHVFREKDRIKLCCQRPERFTPDQNPNLISRRGGRGALSRVTYHYIYVGNARQLILWPSLPRGQNSFRSPRTLRLRWELERPPSRRGFAISAGALVSSVWHFPRG